MTTDEDEKLSLCNHKITKMYKILLDNREFSDVVLCVQDRYIFVISHIIASQSHYFLAAFKSGFAESLSSPDSENHSDKTKSKHLLEDKWPILTLPDLTYDSVFACLEWMYTGQPDSLLKALEAADSLKALDADKPKACFVLVQQAYIASDYFGIKKFSSRLIPYLRHYMDIFTFGDAFELGVQYNIPRLAKDACKLMKSYAPLLKSVRKSNGNDGAAELQLDVEIEAADGEEEGDEEHDNETDEDDEEYEDNEESETEDDEDESEDDDSTLASETESDYSDDVSMSHEYDEESSNLILEQANKIYTVIQQSQDTFHLLFDALVKSEHIDDDE